MDIEHILNNALNKALCSKNRIQRPNSNNIAEFVSEYLKAINYTQCCKSDSELLPKRLSNRAYKNAKTMIYGDFVKWWDEQV